MFQVSKDTVLEELGTSGNASFLGIPLPYAKEDSTNTKCFFTPFRNKTVPGSTVDGRRYIQLVLETQHHHSALPFKLMPTFTPILALILLQ